MDLLNPRYRWIMLLTTMLPLFQQLSGINTCILYSSEVNESSFTSIKLVIFPRTGLLSEELGIVASPQSRRRIRLPL